MQVAEEVYEFIETERHTLIDKWASYGAGALPPDMDLMSHSAQQIVINGKSIAHRGRVMC